MSQEQPVDPTRIVPEGFVFPGTEVLDPREVFAGPGYQAPQQRTDPVAVIALVMTVFTLFPGFGALAALTRLAGDVVAERYGTALADSGRRRRIEDDLGLVTAVMSATAPPGRRLLARIVPRSMVGGRFAEA